SLDFSLLKSGRKSWYSLGMNDFKSTGKVSARLALRRGVKDVKSKSGFVIAIWWTGVFSFSTRCFKAAALIKEILGVADLRQCDAQKSLSKVIVLAWWRIRGSCSSS